MSTQFESIATRAPAIGADPGDVNRAVARRGLSRGVLIAALAAIAWFGSATLTEWWPSADDWPYTKEFIALKLVLAAFAVATGVAGWRSQASKAQTPTRTDAWLHAMPWLLALALGVSVWEAVTAQLEWLP